MEEMIRKEATFEEISIECAKHALEFLHYISTFHNLNHSQMYEIKKFIHIISGYNRVLKKYKKQAENQQLKGLLRECREVLELVVYSNSSNFASPTYGAEYLLPKITNAIGEK